MFNTERHNRPPTLSEYATAKKELECDSECGVDVIVTSDILLDLYWRTIHENKKHTIKVGDSHDKSKFPSKRS